MSLTFWCYGNDDFKTPAKLKVSSADFNNDDGLDYLNGKMIHDINRVAMQGTLEAHSIEGEVPNIILELDELSTYNFGYVYLFLCSAAAVSSYMNGVNPFDQPGVEAYKKRMFKLLNKPE